MAAVNDHVSIGAPFANEMEIHRVVYDFAEDAGATGVLDLLTTVDAVIIKDFHAVVKTACTSGGSAVLDVGVSGGDTNVLLAGVAVASLTANSCHARPLVEGTPNTDLVPFYLAANGKLVQEIKTAAFTAGKIEYVFTVMKA
jgi:hypothetical protein